MINFSRILDNLIVGSCPATAVDARRLAQAGITAVVNLQSDADFRRLGIDWTALENLYHELGVAVYRVPMIDFDEADIARLLPQAADSLNRALGVGHRVYLHCTAGKERSPTTAVAWLAWYGGYTLDEALALVGEARVVNPYAEAVRQSQPLTASAAG